MTRHNILSKLNWIWLLCLVLFNVIPLGNDTNQSLSSNFRLDYLAHAIMILIFAWIWVLGKVKALRFFAQQEVLKYSLIILCAGIGLEFLQLLVPWRTFNPVDMYYNLIGAAIAIGICLFSIVLSRHQ